MRKTPLGSAGLGARIELFTSPRLTSSPQNTVRVGGAHAVVHPGPTTVHFAPHSCPMRSWRPRPRPRLPSSRGEHRPQRPALPPAGSVLPPAPEPPFSRRPSAVEGRRRRTGKLPRPAVETRANPLLLHLVRPATVDGDPPGPPSTHRNIFQQPPPATSVPPLATSCSQRGVMIEGSECFLNL